MSDKEDPADSLTAYLRDIMTPTLSEDDERALGRRKVAGDKEAFDTLVVRNLRLVVNISKRYVGRGLPLLDIIQEGNRGLIKAVEKYDPERNNQFATYASWWIRQSITRSLPEGKPIRLPAHVAEEATRLERLGRQMSQSEGREVNMEEAAELVDIDPEKARSMERATKGVASLDRPLVEGASTSLGDLLEDTNSLDPEELAVRASIRAGLETAIQSLEDDEQEIVRMHFGFDGTPYTLMAIAAKKGITRDRARAILQKSLGKLRSPDLTPLFSEGYSIGDNE